MSDQYDEMARECCDVWVNAEDGLSANAFDAALWEKAEKNVVAALRSQDKASRELLEEARDMLGATNVHLLADCNCLACEVAARITAHLEGSDGR